VQHQQSRSSRSLPAHPNSRYPPLPTLSYGRHSPSRQLGKGAGLSATSRFRIVASIAGDGQASWAFGPAIEAPNDLSGYSEIEVKRRERRFSRGLTPLKVAHDSQAEGDRDPMRRLDGAACYCVIAAHSEALLAGMGIADKETSRRRVGALVERYVGR
jgi:hypothetical protein